MADLSPTAMPLMSPTVAALKEEANHDLATRGHMERTVSQDIREETDDLKRAAEHAVNAIMDLDLDGAIRWVSPSWEQLTGTSAEQITGKKISDIISSENKAIFTDTIESMRKDDAKSRIIRFHIQTRRPSLPSEDAVKESSQFLQVPTPDDDDAIPEDMTLEAQGIMVYDRSSGEESHTMWMIKPAIAREITIDLPLMLVESLGIGAHVLAQYLTSLADMSHPDSHPAPIPVLCRICERQITPWWFEKHTELCLQEHRAEMEIQMAHEALSEHRAAIVKVLDALEAQSKRTRASTPESPSGSPGPSPEYKGFAIGPGSQPSTAPSSIPSSGVASPGGSHSRGRESSATGFGASRARSFHVRRPLARIVELVLDLCDTAMEINTPAIKDHTLQDGEEIRTISPSSESRITQVTQWQSPSSSTLETEEGLSLLCDDTQTLCKAKVDAVYHCRNILEYSERLRVEFDLLVQECIDEALAKAARIAAGELSDASEGSTSDAEALEEDSIVDSGASQAKPLDIPPLRRLPSLGPSSSLAMALRNASDTSLGRERGRTLSSTAASSASNSPVGSRTPRSVIGSLSTSTFQNKRGSVIINEDAAAESDSSFRSSLAAASRRAESPGELSLSRVTSARGRKRTSLALPSLQSNSRQESPVRPAALPPPLSPLRVFKPRMPSGETSASPITSPMQSTIEFTSPVIRPSMPIQHHRRQSSIALGEAYRAQPSSPRLAAMSVPQPKAVQTSIKDFDIIKPISKGAFGSVYLAKKKITGDYYAIKVLKKGDMVAKNQVTNVKAERAIMMWQGESDFVAKLYWTFSSKDYLYLVMEYLNGGDCASLIKTLQGLPEDWAKKYLAEVVLGVQHLHSRQIVHRDLKPDNLLIDQKGHLKLTDFGLSRMGLVGRQKRAQDAKPTDAPDLTKHNPFRRAPSLASSRSASFDYGGQHSPAGTPGLAAAVADLSQPSYFSLNRDSSRERERLRRTSIQRSDSGDSDALQHMFRRFSLADSDALMTPNPTRGRQSTIDEETTSDDAESPDAFTLQSMSVSVPSMLGSGTPPQPQGMLPPPMALFDPADNGRRFVGTPDYLAPETINGVGQDEMSDWWSLGCILFECLYGIPPFHAATPEDVFQNILARNIHWPDEEDDVASLEAKDLINKLLCLDPKERLGANKDDKFESGGDEVRAHPWFADIDWESLREDEASFVPKPANVEDTEYFDSRGATFTNFSAEFEDQASSTAPTPGNEYAERPHDALSRVRMKVNSIKRGLMPLHIPPHVRDGRTRRSSEPAAPDDFGNFQFKNLPVLEKANKDVLSKLRAEAMQAQSKSSQIAAALASSSAQSVPSPAIPIPQLEASPVISTANQRALSISKTRGPATPLILNQLSSSPSRVSQPSSPLLISFNANHHERRKTSSSASTLSQSIQPGTLFDSAKTVKQTGTSAVSSPIKFSKPQPIRDDQALSPLSASSFSPRQRSQTFSSIDDDAKPSPSIFSKRRSQVHDVSPSSSDTEDQRHKALLRVQRRRQSSRRLSQITLAEGPMFRPLDVLICEDHPVSRLVMERLLEKLRCRTISVTNGSEAMRYAMSEVKFDIIMMEFKLPQISGADVARMIRETKNANTHTPIVAVTGYLKELQAPHDFDALIEKPPDTSKLSDVLGRLCMWKPPAAGWTPATSRRKASLLAADDSPLSAAASAVFSAPGERGDSVTSGSIGSVSDRCAVPAINMSDWTSTGDELDKRFSALGISEDGTAQPKGLVYRTGGLAPLVEQRSAPAAMESAISSGSASPPTEAEEEWRLGGSKLATEMMRADSRDGGEGGLR